MEWPWEHDSLLGSLPLTKQGDGDIKIQMIAAQKIVYQKRMIYLNARVQVLHSMSVYICCHWNEGLDGEAYTIVYMHICIYIYIYICIPVHLLTHALSMMLVLFISFRKMFPWIAICQYYVSVIDIDMYEWWESLSTTLTGELWRVFCEYFEGKCSYVLCVLICNLIINWIQEIQDIFFMYHQLQGSTNHLWHHPHCYCLQHFSVRNIQWLTRERWMVRPHPEHWPGRMGYIST